MISQYPACPLGRGWGEGPSHMLADERERLSEGK